MRKSAQEQMQRAAKHIRELLLIRDYAGIALLKYVDAKRWPSNLWKSSTGEVVGAILKPADPKTERPRYTAEWLTWKIPHVLSQSETVSAVLPVAAGSTVHIFLIDPIFLSDFWPIDSTRQVGIGAHSNSQHALLWGREGGVSLSQHSRSTKTRSKMTTTTTTTTNWHCECSGQPIKTDGSAGVRGWNVPLSGMSPGLPGHFSPGWNVRGTF